MLPKKLFDDPYSTVLLDSSGELLSASIAADGQWRFPEIDSVPDKFSRALLAYEDKRFQTHPGVDPFSLARAIKQNLEHGAVVSGGSTITMQVIRLSRKGKPRTFFQKLIEMVLATRLELRFSKDEILALYASHAPFGGNVVGLEAACWRYFSRSPGELSWGEAALLAVLPNSPSLLHPGRNRDLLKSKRDRLLTSMLEAGEIDVVTCKLAQAEPLPHKPHPLPHHARHLLARSMKEGHSGERIHSTLSRTLQEKVSGILKDHAQPLKGNQIFNSAALVVDVQSGNVLAYVGNTETDSKGDHGEAVDVVVAPRSTGSILKPFLYAAMLDEGKILPGTLLPDIPTIINGFAPQNFSREYDGAVHANKALIRSLNVPAVHLLRAYRYEKFHSLLTSAGMTTLNHSADHYGLSLILGGADGTLWDISGMYASAARTLSNYFDRPGQHRYRGSDFHALKYLTHGLPERHGIRSANDSLQPLESTSILSAASIYQTFTALTEVYRPGEESGWRYFNSSKPIAWKTGTSFGFRDGWAIGVTPDFVVGIWVGNADGEGRPGLTGTDAAAPILFDIFSKLPDGAWFTRPAMELEKITVCAISGYRSSPQCMEVDTLGVTMRGMESPACPYHQLVHLSHDRKFRVNSDCEPIHRVLNVPWFILPPVQEYYFRAKNVSYLPLPPLRADCQVASAVDAMELIYPKPSSKVYIPRELSGKTGNAVFHLAHRNPGATVHWHLDGNYLGSTKSRHQLPVNPGKGRHKLVLVDDNGESLEEHFEVLSSM
jgi:penicillin-binding protein 1C